MHLNLRRILGRYAGVLWGVGSFLSIAILWTQPPFTDPLHRMEYALYDLRIRRRIVHQPASNAQVVMVSIDRSDEKHFGRLPWPRRRYADLIRHLHKAGAGAVVMDIFFPDARDEADDRALAQAIKDAGNVFLPKFSLQVRSAADADENGVYRGPLARNLPLIGDAAAGSGHINVVVDTDGIVRRMPARVGSPDGKSVQVPVGFVATRHALGLTDHKVLATRESLTCGPLRVPLDANACIPINYLDFDRAVYVRPPFAPDWVEAEGRRKPVILCSFAEAMGLRTDTIAPYPPVDFRGKVVVVAGTVQGSEADMHSTPYARQYGALIHVAFIHSLLTRQMISVPRQTVLFGWLLAVCLSLGLAAFHIRLGGSAYATVAGMLVALVGLLTALGLVSWALYNYWGIMFQVTPFAVALVLHFGAALATNLSRASRETEETRKAAQAALRESEDYLKSMLDSVRAGIVVIDPQTYEVLDANTYAMEMLRKERAELIGQPCHATFCEFQAGQCPICDLHMPDVTAEAALTHAQDRQLFILKTATLVERQGRQFVIESFVDITNRKRAEEDLLESNQRLQEALDELAATQRQVVQQERLRALGEMASGVAHDFNNALMPVVGYTDMLLMSPDMLEDTERATQYLKNVRAAAEDAQGVVKRLREFYRHRDEDEALVPLDLSQMVRDVLTFTQPKWKEQTQARGLTIDVETDLQDTPPTAGNEVELREMLTNLIFNAVDALPVGGTIRVSTQVDGDQILLQVADTGSGMSDETRRRCLEPFFTTKGERGTGLGLAVTYGIIRRHRGSITIESQEGKGTTFAIRLPVTTDQEAPQVADEQESVSLPPLHVLVADDDPEALDVIVAYLHTDHHTCETAHDGALAWETFQNGHFDVVVTDMAMPGLNGAQIATRVKDLAPSTRVIMVSGFAVNLTEKDGGPENVDVLLAKPVSLAVFRRALATAVGAQVSVFQ